MTHLNAHVSMGANGLLVIPAKMRTALGMEKGGEVVLTVNEDGSLRMEPMQSVIARVQAEVAQYVPADVSLSQDRRAASEYE